MKRLILFAFCILLNAPIYAEKNIINKITSGHQNITGTKISIIPPAGFVKAANFAGFQHDESGSSIMALDIPGPFSAVSKGLTKEGLAGKGIEIAEKEDFKINGISAIFITGIQRAYGNEYAKFILAFGTDEETIFINGACPADNKTAGESIKKSMITAYYESGKKIDPFQTLDFEINPDESVLKLAKNISGSLIFTSDGLIPTKSDEKRIFIAAKSFSKIPVDDKKNFAVTRLKQMSIEQIEIESSGEIEISGIHGIEITASGIDKKSKEKLQIYQTILYSDSLYYILFATADKNFKMNTDLFKKTARTFKKK